MSAPPVLQTLLDHAAAQRDNALAAHRRAGIALQGARAQADQLMAHRQETLQRAAARPSQSSNLVVMQSFHGFMQRLDEAVLQQQQRVELAAQRQRAAQDLLVAAEQRVAAVGKLIEGRAASAMQVAARRDQKAADELASRMAWQPQASPLRGLGAGSALAIHQGTPS